MSLTLRILLSFAVLAIIAFFSLLNPVLDRVERQYLEAAEEPMVDIAHLLAASLSVQHESVGDISGVLRAGMQAAKLRSFEARIYNHLKRDVSMDFYVTDAKGRLLYDTGGHGQVGADYTIHRDVRLTLMGLYGARSTRLDAADWTSSVMYVAAPILVRGEVVGVCSVYKPQGSLHLFIQETKQRLVYLGCVTGILILLTGYLLSRWISAPLRRLTEYAAGVSDGKRSKLPDLPGYHLRVLGETTENMREALEDRQYVESYVQSLTHEMKSPLAGIRSAAELLREDLPLQQRTRFLENIEQESERLQRLIDQLLALASLENRTELGASVAVNLGDVLERIIDQLSCVALEQSIHIRYSGAVSCCVLGEAFLIEMAFSNLLQNAIDFTEPGGSVDVVLRCSDKFSEIIISDEGVGIPEFALARIFDRFYSLPRPHSQRKSSGLGLCFVREAVYLHGGSVTVSNRLDGPRGAIATVRLPVCDGGG